MLTKQQYYAAEKMLRSQDEEIRSLGISIFEADEKFKNTYLTDANIYVEKWLGYGALLPEIYYEPIIQKNHTFIEYMPPYEYYLTDKHHAPTGRVYPSN